MPTAPSASLPKPPRPVISMPGNNVHETQFRGGATPPRTIRGRMCGGSGGVFRGSLAERFRRNRPLQPGSSRCAVYCRVTSSGVANGEVAAQRKMCQLNATRPDDYLGLCRLKRTPPLVGTSSPDVQQRRWQHGHARQHGLRESRSLALRSSAEFCLGRAVPLRRSPQGLELSRFGLFSSPRNLCLTGLNRRRPMLWRSCRRWASARHANS